MVGVLDVDPELLQRQHRLAPDVRARVERRQVEIAALVERLGRAGVAEEEVLELRAHVERFESHRLGTFDRPSQHVARVTLVGGALGGDHVAEHACHPLLLGPPRQDREGAGVGHRDHVRLLDRVEAGDRRAVEAHARLECVVELGGVDRERLQLAEDVGEPEADEADFVLEDECLHVLRRLGLILHRADLRRCSPHGGIDVWPRARPGPRNGRARGASVTGHGRDEGGYRFGFLALVEQGGHLPETARTAFGDGVRDQFAPVGDRFRRRVAGDLFTHADVEVGPGAPDRVGRLQRVADRAGAGEQFAPFLLLCGQVARRCW